MSFILLSGLGMVMVLVILLFFVLVAGEVPRPVEHNDWPALWAIILILLLGAAFLKGRRPTR